MYIVIMIVVQSKFKVFAYNTDFHTDSSLIPKAGFFNFSTRRKLSTQILLKERTPYTKLYSILKILSTT